MTISNNLVDHGVKRELTVAIENRYVMYIIPGRAAYESAFSKPVTHLSAQELLRIYYDLPFRFKTALSNPINQFSAKGDIHSALYLSALSPSLASNQKLYVANQSEAEDFFSRRIENRPTKRWKQYADQDFVYARGIVRLFNRNFDLAIQDLAVVKQSTSDQTRVQYIAELIRRAQRGIVDLYVKKPSRSDQT